MEIATRIARYSILVALCLAGVTASWGQESYQFEWPASVAVDGAGNVYVAEMGRHRVHKYDSNGSLLWRSGSMGPGANQFNSPSGIAVDSSINVFTNLYVANNTYVADTGNARVQILDSNGAVVSRWSSFPRWGSKPGGQLRRPVAIALDGDHYVYVLDAETLLVHKFSSMDTGAVYRGSWGGASGVGDGQFLAGGPRDIAIESKGNNSISAYISDVANHRIHKWAIGSDAAGNIISSAFIGWMGGCTFGSNCEVLLERSRGFQCTSATCSLSSPGRHDGQFFNPLGVAVDSGGNVYVADAANDRIQKFDSAGRFVTKWGSRGDGKVEFRAPVDVATVEFRGPRNVATMGVTAVYVADSRNGRIVRFTNAGEHVSALGGGIAVSAARGGVSAPPGQAIPDSLLDPNTFFMFAGETKTSTITVKSLGLFSGSVDLTPLGAVDQLSGIPGTPSGVTTLSSSSVTVSSGSSKTATLTIDTSTSNKGRFLLPIKIENSRLDIRRDLSIAFEIIRPVADDSVSMAPCPGFYQRSSTPEVLRLANLIKSLHAKKEQDLSNWGPLSIGVAARATSKLGWNVDFEKPTGVSPPLLLSEAFVAMNNPTAGTVGLYAINSKSCGVPVSGLALDPGQSGQMRISTPDTTTLVLSRPLQDIAVFAEPNFWTLFGGRKVTMRWIDLSR